MEDLMNVETVDPGMSVVPSDPGMPDIPTVIPELDEMVSALQSDVSFAKKTWKDGSGGGTPITAAELNRLETGVADLTAAVNALRDSVGLTLSSKGLIKNDVDLNTVRVPGVYCCENGMVNAPSEDWGVLVVFLPHKDKKSNTAQLWLGSRTKSRWTSGPNDRWGTWV